ncbi:PQQ-binding-like beta-propeller repeat protein [Cryobacterium sp. Y57]|uniref:PQQ-binding-like beta-propeller repeat protein n=1 Tax=Cryobacterium sp. Y57 TaxID=2048287 RepID=UPI000CE36237|nr:PQQ-binding-like beta-propeller repeat protein [Cryobacterium sp. Y57]
MSRHVTKTALIGLAVITALSGCATSTAEPKPTTAVAVTDFVTPIEPAWTIDVDLVGKPISQNGYVASYVAAADGALNVVAWDAATGVEVWRDVAAVGATTQGVVVDLGGLKSGEKSFVTYLSPIVGDDSGWSELVIAEIGSGVSTSISNNMVWATQRPAACADDIAVCFTGFLEAADDADRANFRIDPKVGTIVADTDVVMPARARMLSDRLFSTNARSPDGVEELGYSADGAVAWQLPYSDIFAEGYSSDGGWNWDLFRSDEVLVGSGSYFDRARLDIGERVIDLTQTQTVGLDPASGDSLWSLDATSDCPASSIGPELIDDVLPLCRYNSGTMTYALRADGINFETIYADVDIDLLGMDPLSGEVEWTLALGSTSTESGASAIFFETGSVIRAVNVAGAVSLVNALTGDVTDLPDGAIFACGQHRDGFEALQHSSGDVVAYGAGHDGFPCTSDLAAIEGTAYSPGALRMGGLETGENTFVIGGASGLSSYTLLD